MASYDIDSITFGSNTYNIKPSLAPVVNALFPVGSIYMSTSSTAPAFGGTWEEITIPITWDDAENGMRSYTAGTGTGTVHYWRRTA